jgi:hypothetical protein
MQEVQTWIEIYDESTLDTIEAVGTSSRKIIEWRQTRWWHYVSRCEAAGRVKWDYDEWVTDRNSYYVKSDEFAITSQTGNVEFIMQNGNIRLPQAWTYQCTLSWAWWWYDFDDTVYISVWGKVVYTNTFSGSHQSETVTFIFNAWKFAELELGWEFYFSWTFSFIELSISPTMTIQQL